ncbi:MAG: hypothetical protein RL701_7715, partial [Pseudomonadota bacterium]
MVTPTVRVGLDDETAGYRLGARYSADVVSAASVDIVATASKRFNEVRHNLSVDARLKRAALGGAVTAAVSSEPDYLSGSGGLQGNLDLYAGQLALVLGYAGAHDTFGR